MVGAKGRPSKKGSRQCVHPPSVEIGWWVKRGCCFVHRGNCNQWLWWAWFFDFGRISNIESRGCRWHNGGGEQIVAGFTFRMLDGHLNFVRFHREKTEVVFIIGIEARFVRTWKIILTGATIQPCYDISQITLLLGGLPVISLPRSKFFMSKSFFIHYTHTPGNLCSWLTICLKSQLGRWKIKLTNCTVSPPSFLNCRPIAECNRDFRDVKAMGRY